MVDCDSDFVREEMGTDCFKYCLRMVSEGSVHCRRWLLARAVMMLMLAVCQRWSTLYERKLRQAFEIAMWHTRVMYDIGLCTAIVCH